MGLGERIAAARRLQADGATVSGRIMAAVESAVPTYATLAEAQREETRAIATWAVRRLLEMWVDGTATTEADRRRFHGVGVARATDGRPLLAVLRAYRVAATTTTDLVLEVGGDLDVTDVVALNRTLLTSIEDLSEALFAGYSVTRERLAEDRDRSLGGLAHDLLSGRHVSRDALRDRSAQLGVTLPDRWYVVVAAPDGAAPPLTAGDAADLATVVQRLAGAPAATVLHVLRDGRAVVLGADSLDLDQLEAELEFRRWRGCAVVGTATDRLPATYRLAADAVRSAAAARGAGTLLRLPDALYLGVLAGDPAADPGALAAAALGPLLEGKNRHLLTGLRAYLQHGSATEAAAALGLHPQTMRHRLRRTAALTGRDVGRPWDRLLLHTAATAAEVARARG